MTMRYDGLTTLQYDGMLDPRTHGELICIAPSDEGGLIVGMYGNVARAGFRAYLDDTDPLDRQLIAAPGYNPNSIIDRYLQPHPRQLGFLAAHGCRVLIEQANTLWVAPEYIGEFTLRTDESEKEDRVRGSIGTLFTRLVPVRRVD
jgi:hypothetical protein